jgi:hypothetical protein
MMKARKPKQYAQGGKLVYTSPGAGYRPGFSPEHLYFQPPKADPAAAATAAATEAAPAGAAAGAAPAPAAPAEQQTSYDQGSPGNAKGGLIKMKKMAKGGAVKSGRGDGCAMKGKTKGRTV